jgi:hypothetical protein
MGVEIAVPSYKTNRDGVLVYSIETRQQVASRSGGVFRSSGTEVVTHRFSDFVLLRKRLASIDRKVVAGLKLPSKISHTDPAERRPKLQTFLREVNQRMPSHAASRTCFDNFIFLPIPGLGSEESAAVEAQIAALQARMFGIRDEPGEAVPENQARDTATLANLTARMSSAMPSMPGDETRRLKAEISALKVQQASAGDLSAKLAKAERESQQLRADAATRASTGNGFGLRASAAFACVVIAAFIGMGMAPGDHALHQQGAPASAQGQLNQQAAQCLQFLQTFLGLCWRCMARCSALTITWGVCNVALVATTCLRLRDEHRSQRAAEKAGARQAAPAAAAGGKPAGGAMFGFEVLVLLQMLVYAACTTSRPVATPDMRAPLLTVFLLSKLSTPVIPTSVVFGGCYILSHFRVVEGVVSAVVSSGIGFGLLGVSGWS